jgi:hypothetical protein
MDTLPLVLTGPCLGVKSVTVTRMMVPSKRRFRSRRKSGPGATVAEFRQKIDQGDHRPSACSNRSTVAAGLGWENAAEQPPRRWSRSASGQASSAREGDRPPQLRAHLRSGEPAIVLDFVAHAG